MANVNLQALIDRQNELAYPIERAITNLKKVGEANLTKRRITGRLEALRSHWKAYQENHENIMDVRNTTSDKAIRKLLDEAVYFKENHLLSVEEVYLEAQEEMEIRLDAIIANEPANATVAEQSVHRSLGTSRNHRLPKIELPTFDGNPRDWISFRDLFVALVGSSPELDDVEKLFYLKTKLLGTAAQRIQSIALTNANFTATWDYLSSIYENKRLLVNTSLRDFMDTKPVAKTSATELDLFTSEVTRAITALETLGQYNVHCDAFVVFIVVSKLDANTVREWEESQGCSQQMPSWVKLRKFLEARVRSVQAYELARQRSTIAANSQPPKDKRSRNVATVQAKTPASPKESSSTSAASPSSTGCSDCGANHYIAACRAFRTKTQAQRRTLVMEKQLCFNCLGTHKVAMCRSQKRCQTCSGQHNTLLHVDSANSTQTTTNAVPRAPQQITNDAVTVSLAVSRSLASKRILLTTALIRVQAPRGEEVHARALLDTGSELSFISERLAQLLKLSRRRCNIPLVGIGARRSGSTNGAVTYTLRPHFESNFRCRVDALTLDKITADFPSLDAQERSWTHLQGLQLADPDYATTGQIDILLGADIYGQLLDTGLRQGASNTPVAHLTKLGWVLSGPTSTARTLSTPTHGFQCAIDRDPSHYELQSAIERFWVQEEVKSTTPIPLSVDEQECEAHFLSTHTRDNTGRFTVRLPFKMKPTVLGNSRERAQRVLSRMTKRLSADSKLQSLYRDFLRQYEALGHMQLAPNQETAPDVAYYLPHHGVLKESSTTTKLRVVFNGSAQTTSDYSLNDVLHTGAKLQTDLPDVILRWQKHQFAFAADIEKMFRRIKVHPDDWDYQRILWSHDLTQPSQAYQLTTVTYGLGPAPFLANRVLRELASNEEKRFPLAAEIIRQSTYVDDTFGGADTLEAAQEAVQQLDSLCMAGGFPLQKWNANYSVVLSNMAPDRLARANTVTLEDDTPMRALGIIWRPSSDYFEFSGFRVTQEAPFTKRKILSTVSQLFDPLGWLSPVIIRAKVLMQDLWIAQVGWDEELTEPLVKRWQQFLDELQNVTTIKIPRWLGTSPDALAVEIHGFSDASVHAMAAVVYLRILHDVDDAHIALLGSKTKVAPIKPVTIPRLELTAATLLARQVAHLRVSLNLAHAPVHLWTDSSVTLAWIRADPSRWKEFVRNRVDAIQKSLPNARWHHVAGADNPADCASRGLTPQQLNEHQLWWKGPDWLSRHSTSWPASTPTPLPEINLEEKSKVVATARIIEPWKLLERYSSLTKLLRVTATCRRWRTRRSPTHLPLTPEEIERELVFWVKTVQGAHFNTEIKILSEGKSLPNSNPLSRLTPFLDSGTGLLRLGGRLQNAIMDPDMKHPLILPANSYLSTLVIYQGHAKTLHGGTQSTLGYIRRKYWILGGRTPVRSHIFRCMRCTRFRGIAARQLMGQLPPNRSRPSRPFLHSGVDYAGPLTVKTWRGRNTKTYKGYIVVFVCFSTSALHLELVTDYTTDAFLAAFKRFTGRRGICATLTSDCGTNLVGADNELRRLFDKSSKELGTLSSLLASDGTEWRFNPPSAPHFGGKWEAGVKSVKFHLRRAIGDHALTYEELSTLLIQIEAVLNSRPLCPLSDDPADVNALTPGHFLTGSALTTVPEVSFSTLPASRLSRWQLVTQMLGHFWTRWSAEYLQRFLAVSKWRQPTEEVKPGSLVLIIDERYPPSKWPLARVTETHPGKDALTRVVTLKTATATYKRPITKLCLLPLHSPETSTPEL